MSDHPILLGFGGPTKPIPESPMEFVSHHLIGGNPADPDHGYWDTKEEALINFALQFSELSTNAQHDFLFVRRAPALFQDKTFGGEIKYRMIGRFSIAKFKERNT